jgi:hypothetical protein
VVVSGSRWHLAQVNVGTLRHPTDHPDTAEFMDNLDPVNAVADVAPGFVWRLQDDTGNATGFARDGDPLRILNLSVWESVEALRAFTNDPRHLAFLRRRREWFRPHDGPHLVLWWVPAGHRPSIEEAEERLSRLAAEGPSADGFTFARPHPPPG